MEYKYDVTLSFAGEDRVYVEKTAQILVDNGIKVFYDKFEEVDLWGKDLGVHFGYIYRKSAKYCIPFISTHYKQKIWTSHEIRTAISRAIESNEEYILPARFDETEIEGIRPTLGYINLQNLTPEKFAELIIRKLEKEIVVPVTEREQENDGNVYLSVNALISEFQGFYGTAIGVSITNTIKEYRYFNEPYFKLTKPFEDQADALYFTEKLMPVMFPVKLEYGQVIRVDYNIKPRALKDIWEKLPPDTQLYAIVTTTVGEKFKSNFVEVSDIVKSLKRVT
ncbi:MAG: TIR domain-containing protein [archaeon]|nr:TIR domain-containing protein [archaeon]